MKEHEAYSAIDASTFDALLKQYPNVVPAKLAELDMERYETIPESLDKAHDGRYLTKEQVLTLVAWKLSHGTFRPSLKKLVGENSSEQIRSLTGSTFEGYQEDKIKECVKDLTTLRGVGPATASLLLSCQDPSTVPFFSDELFRWCFYEEGRGQGWDRRIKYTLKEYVELFSKVRQLQKRLLEDFEREVSALEVEKVAYVLGNKSNEDETADKSEKFKKRKAASGAKVDAPPKANKDVTEPSNRLKRKRG